MSITYHYINNHNLKDLGSVMDEYKLYEKSYSDSHFKDIIDSIKKNVKPPVWGFADERINITHYSTVIAKKNGKPISILIFENYNLIEQKNNLVNFVNNKEKKTFRMLGFLCLYVKPKHRYKNIATKMVETFDEHHINYVEKEDSLKHINLVAGVQVTKHILLKRMKNFKFTHSSCLKEVWKKDAKNLISSIDYIQSFYGYPPFKNQEYQVA